MAEEEVTKEQKEAMEADKKVRGIYRVLDASWWELGRCCLEMKQSQGWRLIGFKSFGSWLDDALQVCRKTAYDAMKCVQALDRIPFDTKKQLPKQNAKLLSRMPESKRFDPVWIERAKTMKEAEFKAAVEGQQVGAEKAEPLINKRFAFEQSQWETVDKAIQHLANFEEIKAPAAALEAMAADYLSGVEQ